MVEASPQGLTEDDFMVTYLLVTEEQQGCPPCLSNLLMCADCESASINCVLPGEVTIAHGLETTWSYKGLASF